MEQIDDGCDYTIGCGVRVDVWSAMDEADLMDALHAEIVKGEIDGTEQELESLRYVPLSAVRSFPLDAAREARRTVRARKAEQDQEARERALYESLQAKYGGCR